jgi:alpha-beta hydrolase superfamily lysophospholipase
MNSYRWIVPTLLVLTARAGAQGDYPVSVPVMPGMQPPVYQRLEVAARDGIKLTVHEWAPARRAVGAPVVLFLHGIGMHGEPEGAVAAGFTRHGLVFAAPDLRGHGRSEGARGVLPEAHVLRADLGAILGLMGKRYPGAPITLVGDSMGGLLAVDYAWRGERRLARLVLLGPAFRVHPGTVENPVSELLGAVGRGRVALGTADKIGPCSRDPGFVRARLADRLALPEVRLSYLLTLAQLQQDWPRAAPEIRLPLFVAVAGKDRVVDNQESERFFKRAATPSADKVLRRFEDACHTLTWDPVAPVLVEELAQWIRQAPREQSAASPE